MTVINKLSTVMAPVSMTPAILVSSMSEFSVKKSMVAITVSTTPTTVSNPKPNTPTKPRVRIALDFLGFWDSGS